ncbi:HTH-type transcriptional regulator RutR [Aquirhabdus sp.]|uniref:HTH-type transcriptional regulator RutR n=1 Tax=Aquirhabdus sp. TaxID=2824160 RepID=UPI00396C7ED2
MDNNELNESQSGVTAAKPIRAMTKKKLVKADSSVQADGTESSSLSPSRRQRSVELKTKAIKDSALAVFSMYGFHGSSLEQIAELAGVSKANLLYYFSSKDDLYLYVLRDILSVWMAPFEALSADQDAVSSIKEYIKQKLEVSRDYPQASRLFCLEMIQGAPLLKSLLEGKLRKQVREKAKVIKAWSDAGQIAPIDPFHLIFTLWATTQHYADFHVQIEAITGKTLDNDRFLKSTVENIQSLIINGLRPRSE